MHQWCPQPHFNRRLRSGNFLIWGSLLTNGNKYGKMALLAELLSLKPPPKDQNSIECQADKSSHQLTSFRITKSDIFYKTFWNDIL